VQIALTPGKELNRERAPEREPVQGAGVRPLFGGTLSLAVSAIAVPGFDLFLGGSPPIGTERFADVVALLEFSRGSSPNESAIRIWLDEGSFTARPLWLRCFHALKMVSQFKSLHKVFTRHWRWANWNRITWFREASLLSEPPPLRGGTAQSVRSCLPHPFAIAPGSLMACLNYYPRSGAFASLTLSAGYA
jgi:hypothetical protein